MVWEKCHEKILTSYAPTSGDVCHQWLRDHERDISHSRNIVGKTRTPTTPDQVKLHTKAPAKYEEIAIVSADAAHDFMGKQELMNIAISKIKAEATKVGANGVLLDGVGDFYTGSSGVGVVPSAIHGAPVVATGAMNARSGKKASGMAIFVIEEKP